MHDLVDKSYRKRDGGEKRERTTIVAERKLNIASYPQNDDTPEWTSLKLFMKGASQSKEPRRFENDLPLPATLFHVEVGKGSESPRATRGHARKKTCGPPARCGCSREVLCNESKSDKLIGKLSVIADKSGRSHVLSPSGLVLERKNLAN